MSGAFPWLSRIKLRTGTVLNRSGNAGPRRLAAIIGIVLLVAALVAAVSLTGTSSPRVSKDAKMGAVNPLPGGLYSTPEQDAQALVANDAEAAAAARRGVSYTPPLAPSVPAAASPPKVEEAIPTQGAPRAVARPAAQSVSARAVVPAPLLQPAVFPAPATEPKPIPVAAVADPTAGDRYNKQIADLFSQWGGRVPRTDVVLPPSEQDGQDLDPPASRSRNTAGSARDAAPLPVSARVADTGQLLIPAGRGVFAHPILALNSDQSSPVVLQADSGPIAGDRMIGSFARQSERLVLHISTVLHNGEAIGVDGVVTAPDTMEAAVASDVDEHYAARFILPAAAAFVAGLGQAIATTSNTTAVLSPFGGATTITHLNIDQQLGIAAGVAAAQVANTLAQAAPKGPTVTLDANVAVGVMFLANVTAHRGQ